MDKARFEHLLNQYIFGEISSEDREELARMANEDAYEALLDATLRQDLQQQPLTGQAPDDHIKQLLLHRLPGHDFWPATRKVRMPFPRWAAAAVLVLVAAASWLVINQLGKKPAMERTAIAASAIVPAGNKAVLTLNNGRQIVLEQVSNGDIAEESGIRIVKKNGRLLYQKQQSTGTDAPASINTLSTPRGGQIQIELPDGTIVWMNSASTLNYPTAFTGTERTVELNGEAYFDVAPNAQQPFKVKTNGMLVDVLGTSFDLHAYPDEPVCMATLVKGSVRITSQATHKESLLMPGQQAVATSGELLTRPADLEQVLSWKNGLFIFENRTLPDILREVSRWYDIDIEYRTTVSDERYSGLINRNSTLNKVMDLLQQNGIHHFKTEGRKLVVLP